MAAVCSVVSETSTDVTGSDCAGSDHWSIENGKAAVERCRKNAPPKDFSHLGHHPGVGQPRACTPEAPALFPVPARGHWDERRCGVGPGVRRSSLCSCPSTEGPWPISDLKPLCSEHLTPSSSLNRVM